MDSPDIKPGKLLFTMEPRMLPVDNLVVHPDLHPGFAQSLLRLICTGGLQSIHLAPTQSIPPDLGFGRNVEVVDPYDPDSVYVVSGVGYCRRKRELVDILPPAPNITVDSLIDRSKLPHAMGTKYVLPDGSQNVVINQGPVGCYSPEDLRAKLDGTEQAKKLFGTSNAVAVPKIVMTGRYENLGVHFMVYKKSAHIMDLAEIAQVNTDVALGAARDMIKALKILHKSNFVHNQLHVGNWGMQYFPKKQLWMLDFETLQNLDAHSRKLMTFPGEIQASPRDYAKLCDFSLWLRDVIQYLPDVSERVTFMAKCIADYADIGLYKADYIETYLRLSRQFYLKKSFEETHAVEYAIHNTINHARTKKHEFQISIGSSRPKKAKQKFR